MAVNSVVRARIDEQVKADATAVLSEMGLTVSDAVRMFLAKVARDGVFPFDPTPNALTAETMRRSERGEDVHHADSRDELFKALGI